jgi:2,4-dienoyl-CoA reductase-like NADH-dependent reductase (Old Yellow Enzyme family)
MSQHEPFVFRTSEKLLEKASGLGINLPFQSDLSSLFEEISIGQKRVPNRFAIQPMEGYDGNPDGSPGELTFRRYSRFAQGGSGLIWFEATAVLPIGRSNPRQLWLHKQSLDGFKRLVEETRRAALKAFGSGHEIYCVLQLTHSGRYSKPEGKPRPQVALVNPYLDEKRDPLHLFSDEELDDLQENYIEAVRLAHQVGFDSVDLKACHGYLINELLASYGRKESRYGDSFDNRIRFLSEVIPKIRQEAPEIDLAVRLNAHDGLPYPYGFGVSRDESLTIDLAEPKELIRRLIQEGCTLFNITLGIPYMHPHLSRPFNRPLFKSPLPQEHPLEGVSRFLTVTRNLQREFPEIPLVGTGYSWLRQFLPYVGAAVLNRKEATFIGLGRSAIAYPDAPKDLMNRGTMNPKMVCTTCSRCSELMRMGGVAGCVVRDKETYGKIHKELRKKFIKQLRRQTRRKRREK